MAALRPGFSSRRAKCLLGCNAAVGKRQKTCINAAAARRSLPPPWQARRRYGVPRSPTDRDRSGGSVRCSTGARLVPDAIPRLCRKSGIAPSASYHAASDFELDFVQKQHNKTNKQQHQKTHKKTKTTTTHLGV